MAIWKTNHIPLSFVVAGDGSDVGRAVLAHAVGNPSQYHPPIDVRQWLETSPVDSEVWALTDLNFDSRDVVSQIDVLSSQGFYKAVSDITAVVEKSLIDGNSGKVFVLYDTNGRHRAHCLAHVVAQRVFNGDREQAPFGLRFNANVFPTSECRSSHVVSSVLAEAVMWATEPWLLHPFFPYGVDAESQSFKVFSILEFVDDLGEEVRSGERTGGPPLSESLSFESDHRPQLDTIDEIAVDNPQEQGGEPTTATVEAGGAAAAVVEGGDSLNSTVGEPFAEPDSVDEPVASTIPRPASPHPKGMQVVEELPVDSDDTSEDSPVAASVAEVSPVAVQPFSSVCANWLGPMQEPIPQSSLVASQVSKKNKLVMPSSSSSIPMVDHLVFDVLESRI